VLVLVTVPSIWAVLGRKWIIARILLLPAMIILSALFLSAAFHEWRYYIFRVVALSVASVWLLASLAVVRLAGYRLAWWWRFSRKHLGHLPSDRDAPPESTGVVAGKPVGQTRGEGRLP
jgi:cytochrome c biogenesis protein CcdA